MKKRPLMTTALLLSLSFYTSCSGLDTPTHPSNPSVDHNGNITPFPKGPKELDGITIYDPIPGLPTTDLRRGAAKDTSAINEQVPMVAPPAMAESDSYSGDSGGSNAMLPTPQGTAAPGSNTSDTSSEEPVEEQPVDPIPDAQNFFYFSYDDSASTAGVEQTKFALGRANPVNPNPSWVRPWEFLNYETFTVQNLKDLGTFQVAMGLWQHTVSNTAAGDAQAGSQTAYDLGVQVKTPEISKAQRQNLVLTLLLDVSGSMDSASVQLNESGQTPNLLAVAKAGLRALPAQLKAGDVVNLITFSDNATTRVEAWKYEGDTTAWLAAVDALRTESGTNLNAGLQSAYALARTYYDANKTNRVMMLTDAYANQGQVNADIIAQNTRINNAEGIYFSGLGFGFDFNEGFLNTLTEAGKGSYTSVISVADAERAFGERFIALTQIAARDVRFRLDYPAALQRTVSAAEQSSQVASEVEPIHFAANSSQYFLERFQASGEGNVSGSVKLTIAYTDPVSGEGREEVLSVPVSELLNQELSSIKDARMVTLLTQLILGKITPQAAREEMQSLLQSHSSALASEYQKYIEIWLRMNPESP